MLIAERLIANVLTWSCAQNLYDKDVWLPKAVVALVISLDRYLVHLMPSPSLMPSSLYRYVSTVNT